jgi:hypothetical protein
MFTALLKVLFVGTEPEESVNVVGQLQEHLNDLLRTRRAIASAMARARYDKSIVHPEDPGKLTEINETISKYLGALATYHATARA